MKITENILFTKGICLLILFFFPVILLSEKTPYEVTKKQNGIELLSGYKKLSLEFINPAIVRVKYVPEGEYESNNTNVCIPREQKNTPFKFQQKDEKIFLESDLLKIEIDRFDGSIKYFTKTGNLLLKENEQFPRLTEKIEIETVE
ncbi:MAG: DUF4968 domain-containing protein, partial [Dysgonomonas sp.]|nr:DUF4968 domain-containing protein [Dysgonomonas sp.]